MDLHFIWEMSKKFKYYKKPTNSTWKWSVIGVPKEKIPKNLSIVKNLLIVFRKLYYKTKSIKL